MEIKEVELESFEDHPSCMEFAASIQEELSSGKTVVLWEPDWNDWFRNDAAMCGILAHNPYCEWGEG